MAIHRKLGGSLLLLLVSVGVLVSNRLTAQTEGLDVASERTEINQRIQQIQRDRLMTEELKKSGLGNFEKALSILAETDTLAAQRAEYEAKSAEAPQLIEALQTELGESLTDELVNLPESPTSDQIRQALAEARAGLDARQEALRAIEGVRETRLKRRTEIANRIAILNQRQNEIETRIRAIQQTESQPTIGQSLRAIQRADQLETMFEITLLRAEASSYDARARLVPLRRTQAQRRVIQMRRLVADLDGRWQATLVAETEAYFAEIRTTCEAATKAYPELSPLTAEILRFADQLAGDGGVRARRRQFSNRLTQTRGLLEELHQMSEVTRRKFDATGLRGAAQEWFPEVPEDLPELVQLKRDAREIAIQIPDTQHALIMLEEVKSDSSDTDRILTEWREKAGLSAGSPGSLDFEIVVRPLLETRRELLDNLLVEFGGCTTALQELYQGYGDLIESLIEFIAYVKERVFWVRSVPGSLLPDRDGLSDAFLWLFANPEWRPSLLRSMRDHTNVSRFLIVLGFIVVLLLVRRRLHNYLKETSREVSSSTSLSIWPSVRGLLITIVLAAPIPLLLFALSWFIREPAPTEVALAVSRALSNGALLAFGLEFLVQLLKADGIAQDHFQWRALADESIGRNIRSASPLLVFLSIVTLTFSEDFQSFIRPAEESIYMNSLGRMAFILFCVTLWILLYRILNYSGSVSKAISYERFGEVGRWAKYLGLPLLSSLALGAAVLALAGYYLTAFSYMQRLMRAVLFLEILITCASLLRRWRMLRILRAAVLARERAGEASGQTVTPDGKIVATRQDFDVGTAHGQVRRISQIALTLVTLVGLLAIWSDLLPSFGIVERVQVWPTFAVQEDSRAVDALLTPISSAPRSASEDTDAGEGTQAKPSLPGPLAALSKATPADPAADSAGNRIVLSDVLWCLLTLILTALVARDIPGLLEFMLLQRLPITSGDRYAISTVVRYVIVIGGITSASSQLGLSWNSIQWLAAAFSFGLAFGLQEIFANFISGLIILFERPMRVGDAVEIGQTAGIVTKIRMRATTISTWSRAELVVPNKDFITGQLVNWTLSSPKVRVELPVGVAYGSDVELVKETLLGVAAKHPAVIEEPDAPSVIFREFGDSALLFELRVFLMWDYGRMKARGELNTAIDAAFREKHIVIAFPQVDVHMDPAALSKPQEGTFPATASDSG